METQIIKHHCDDASDMYSNVSDACSFIAHMGLSFTVDRLSVNRFIVSSRPSSYRLDDDFPIYVYEIYF